MARPQADVIVAGHLCLDIIPQLSERQCNASPLFVPGKLAIVGQALATVGGVVSNTGLPLRRLGVSARLVGRVGDDWLGRATLDLLRTLDVSPADEVGVVPGEHSSYTFVINPPGVDRFFMHYPGANDSFCANDILDRHLADARLFHFGYPPLMRCMYADGGQELEALLHRVRSRGIATSLDMAMPDPSAESGRVDWMALLARVMPYTDLFFPSLDEILFMMDRERSQSMDREAGVGDVLSLEYTDLLSELSERLVRMGAAVVGLKLGSRGLYIRTTDSLERLCEMGGSLPMKVQEWRSRELLAPTFQVKAVGTTGAGDSTIAGFVAGFLRGLPLEVVMTSAVAVGACRVESGDAWKGIPTWTDLQVRVRSGWRQRLLDFSSPGWYWDQHKRVWIGPNDAGRR